MFNCDAFFIQLFEQNYNNTIIYCNNFQMNLPLMHQDTRKEGELQSEKITEFYHVENMYTFENIGFTLTVDNYKYLSCADCDAGPVGYYDMNTKHSYVALSRVEHA